MMSVKYFRDPFKLVPVKKLLKLLISLLGTRSLQQMRLDDLWVFRRLMIQSRQASSTATCHNLK